MGSYSRVRSVKLKRNSPEDPFGFTLRGGQEHGTGIFVSSVTPKSIAHKQGLKVGDQILRVNGFPLSFATHKECLAVMSIRNSISLKIRSVGMIPVRERGEPLTWFLIDNTQLPSLNVPVDPSDLRMRHSTFLSPKRSDGGTSPPGGIDHIPENIYINTNGHVGLGCCICRGPPHKPGIFVQSTKSNGVAREAGLRPGDQILECNGHSFRDVEFPEAIYHLKSSKELRLVVVKGGACDLFPGESSGYNSSSSSVNGETITSHVSVSSETSAASDVNNLEEALGRVQVSPGTGSEDPKSMVPLDRNMEWEEVEQVWRCAKKESLIIQIKGELPPLQDQIRHKELQLELERRNLEEEQRKLQQEAQKLEQEKQKFEEEKRKALEERTELESGLVPSGSTGGSPSPAGHSKQNDLAGALSNEILKRSTRRELQQQLEPSLTKAKDGDAHAQHFSAADDMKRRQHEQLIEEFKRAHRKMFAQSQENGRSSPTEDHGNAGGSPRQERASFRAKRTQKEFEHTKKMVQNHVAGIVRQRQLKIERQNQEVQETEREVIGDGKPKSRAPQPPNDVSRKPTPVNSKSPHLSTSPPPAIRIPAKTSLPPDKKLLDEKIRDKVQDQGQGHRGTRGQHHVEFSDRPQSPSPDYSNTPSPEFGRRYVQHRRNEGHQKSRSIVPGILKT